MGVLMREGLCCSSNGAAGSSRPQQLHVAPAPRTAADFQELGRIAEGTYGAVFK